jgi:hypothetical protein
MLFSRFTNLGRLVQRTSWEVRQIRRRIKSAFDHLLFLIVWVFVSPSPDSRLSINRSSNCWLYDVFLWYSPAHKTFNLVQIGSNNSTSGLACTVDGRDIGDPLHHVEDSVNLASGEQLDIFMFPVGNRIRLQCVPTSGGLAISIAAGAKRHEAKLHFPPVFRPYRLCAATMVKNDVHLLPEWLAYHESIGIERFFIYDNKSPQRRHLRRVLQPWTQTNRVTLIDWDYPYYYGDRAKTWLKCQRGQMNHCLYRYGQLTDWLLFSDVDEYVFPVCDSEMSLVPLLDDFKDQPEICSLQLNMIWFGEANDLSPSNSLYTEKFTRRAAGAVLNGRQKCIVRPGSVGTMDVHSVRNSLSGSRQVSIDPKRFRVNHYYDLSYQKRGRIPSDLSAVTDLGMRRFGDKIRQALNIRADS